MAAITFAIGGELPYKLKPLQVQALTFEACMSGYKIGALAECTRTNAPTIRYYEQIGLLRRPDRQEGNQRRYGDDDVHRLTFIRRCREFGFSIDQVRTLASLIQDRTRSCTEAYDIALAHLAEVRAKLRELVALEESISAFVATCDAKCVGGPGPDCVSLDELSISYSGTKNSVVDADPGILA